jgi:hypothetical protein
MSTTTIGAAKFPRRGAEWRRHAQRSGLGSGDPRRSPFRRS